MPSWVNYGFVAVLTYYLVTIIQTFLHRAIAHRRCGGKIYRNHVTCHHRNYRGRQMLSECYIEDELNDTPWFLPPALLMACIAYSLLPLDLFVAHVLTICTAFWAHVYLHAQYHVDGSWLTRFRWFRRKRELHFVHHRHMDSNFGVIEFIWDKWFGTFRNAVARDEFGLNP